MEDERRRIDRRFRLALLGYAILTLGFVSVTIVLSHSQDRLERHQDALKIEQVQIKVNQQRIMRNQVLILRLTTNTAAAICLTALADEKQEVALVHEFNRTHRIDLRRSPICRKAVSVAASLILVDDRRHP